MGLKDKIKHANETFYIKNAYSVMIGRISLQLTSTTNCNKWITDCDSECETAR